MAQQQQQDGLSPTIIVGLGIAGGVAATWFGYPGLVVVAIAVCAAGWMAVPAMLTGRKNAQGAPTAASPAEEAAMLRYRMWSEMKWGVFTPNKNWLPGWPIRMVWLISVFAAFAALALPTPALGDWWRVGNAVALFTTLNQFYGAKRQFAAPDDPSPGVTHDYVLNGIRGGQATAAIAGAVAAAAVAFVGVIFTLNFFELSSLIRPVQPWALGLALSCTAASAVLMFAWRNEALQKWQTMVATRAEWKPYWETLKLDPAPRLLDYDELGPAKILTFDTPPTLGAQGLFALTEKILPLLGTGTRIAILETPNLDSQNNPIEGTMHPTKVQLVQWPNDELPSLYDPQVDEQLLSLYIRCGLAWWADKTGWARGILVGLNPLHKAPDGEDDGEQRTAAWELDVAWTMGLTLDSVRNGGAVGDISAALQAEVLISHRAPDEGFYVGALTDGTTDFKNPKIEKELENLATEDRWVARWTDVQKMGAAPPRIEHATYQESELPNGTTLFRQAFVVRQGIDPTEYFKQEPKIATALSAAPFVAVTGFLIPGGGGRPAERHAQGFVVMWSERPVPGNPDSLAPDKQAGPRSRAKNTAQQWVLSGRINSAFDASRLARPEIASAKCLTDSTSRGHIWRIALRLYGGVTLAEVRGYAQKIRQHLGSEWLRIEEAKDGCVIVAGVSPSSRGVKFASPEEKNREYVTQLDWEQAFSDAKVVGVGGVLPKLVGTSTLPLNEAVQVLDFKLPPGLDRATVKAATPKLMTATGNLFVEPRGVGGADTIRLLVSKESPLPSAASVDWDAVDDYAAEGKLAFASGVDGSPCLFDPKDSPHVLIAGASGGGKSVSLQVLLYPALVAGAELYVIDPTKGGADFQFAKPYSKAFAATVPEASAVMKAVYAEVLHRKNLNAQHGVGGYRDLPESIRPPHIYVLMDEFTSLMQPDPVNRQASDDPEVEAERQAVMDGNTAKAYIGTMAGKIAREARSAGVTLLLATQKLSAKMLDNIPGAGDLKTNLARMLMGNSTYGEKMSALRNPDEAPPLGDVIPKGRGLWESAVSNAELIQVWFEAQQEEFGRHLAERRQPYTDEEFLDLTPFMPKKGSSSSRDEEEPPAAMLNNFPFKDDEEEVVDLGEIEFSLDDFGLEDVTETADDDEEAGQQDMAPSAIVLVGDAELGGYADVGLVEQLPHAPADGSEETGWWKLDAALSIIAQHDVSRVVWVDPDLADVDDIGITYEELAHDVLTELGYSVELIADAPSSDRVEPSPTLPVAAPKLTPAPPSAAVDAPAAKAEPAHVAASSAIEPAHEDDGFGDGFTSIAPVTDDGSDAFEAPRPPAISDDDEFL